MAWALKFSGDEDGIKVLNLSGLVTYTVTLSHDMGGSGGANYGRYFFDGRHDGDGYSGYIYNQGTRDVSNIEVNGIAANHVDIFNAVSGDVISFQANTGATGSSVTIGAKGSGGSSLVSAGIFSIEIEDSVSTRFLDATASDHNNSSGETTLTDTVGGNDATCVNMDVSAWIDLGGNETNVEQAVSVISTEQLTESQLVTNPVLSNINAIVTESLSQALLSNIIIDNKAVLAITEQLDQCIAIDVSNEQLVSFVQSQQQNEAIIVNVATSGAQDINVIVTQQETHTQAVKIEELQPLKTVTTEQIAQVISLDIDQFLPINVAATEQISQAVSIIVNESSGALIFVVESEQLTQLIDVDIDINESMNAAISEQLTQHSARRIHVDLLISTSASEQFTQFEIINVLQRNITTQQSINFDNIFLESLTPVYTIESLTPIYIIERTH